MLGEEETGTDFGVHCTMHSVHNFFVHVEQKCLRSEMRSTEVVDDLMHLIYINKKENYILLNIMFP